MYLITTSLIHFSTVNRLKGDEEQIGGYDLIYKGGPIRPDPKATFTSYLGCFNNRVTQLKKLAKCTAARLSQHYNAE